MADKRKISPERAREIGKLGAKAGPWKSKPATSSRRAQEVFAQTTRLHLIKKAAKRSNEEEME